MTVVNVHPHADDAVPELVKVESIANEDDEERDDGRDRQREKLRLSPDAGSDRHASNRHEQQRGKLGQ